MECWRPHCARLPYTCRWYGSRGGHAPHGCRLINWRMSSHRRVSCRGRLDHIVLTLHNKDIFVEPYVPMCIEEVDTMSQRILTRSRSRAACSVWIASVILLGAGSFGVSTGRAATLSADAGSVSVSSGLGATSSADAFVPLGPPVVVHGSDAGLRYSTVTLTANKEYMLGVSGTVSDTFSTAR